MFTRIRFDMQIMGGRACIQAMRVPISVNMGWLARGATAQEVLEDYPDLEPEHVQQALE
jgi:uncharacterized protein (DUF433 family)